MTSPLFVSTLISVPLMSESAIKAVFTLVVMTLSSITFPTEELVELLAPDESLEPALLPPAVPAGAVAADDEPLGADPAVVPAAALDVSAPVVVPAVDPAVPDMPVALPGVVAAPVLPVLPVLPTVLLGVVAVPAAPVV